MTSTRKREGRIGLIVGAGHGLGGAIAVDLARARAHVANCEINKPASKETRAIVEAEGGAVPCLAMRYTIQRLGFLAF